MSSGFFPVNPHDEWGRRLWEARNLIQEVIDEWAASRGDLGREDLAHDHCFIHDLQHALAHIGPCVRLDETDAILVHAVLQMAEKKRDLAQAEVEHWQQTWAQAAGMERAK